MSASGVMRSGAGVLTVLGTWWFFRSLTVRYLYSSNMLNIRIDWIVPFIHCYFASGSAKMYGKSLAK